MALDQLSLAGRRSLGLGLLGAHFVFDFCCCGRMLVRMNVEAALSMPSRLALSPGPRKFGSVVSLFSFVCHREQGDERSSVVERTGTYL